MAYFQVPELLVSGSVVFHSVCYSIVFFVYYVYIHEKLQTVMRLQMASRWFQEPHDALRRVRAQLRATAATLCTALGTWRESKEGREPMALNLWGYDFYIWLVKTKAASCQTSPYIF